MADWGEKVTGRYKIKPGDNLISISSKLDVPIDSLQLYNNISNPDKVKIGQELLWRRDPSLGENLTRWLFESDKETQESRDINNKIQNTINKTNGIDPEYESLKSTIFKTKDIGNFSNVMSKIYTKVLTDLNLPLHNVPNLVRQDALESSYGTSTRGNGFNLGGVKVFQDKEKLGTKYKDGFYYRNFGNLEDYARYKVNLLENDYGGIISAPASEFIDRLHGKNPGKKNYSANKRHYINSFKGMRTLDSYLNKLNQGGIIKAQDGWTSEDIGNPVYKKNWTPKKDKEALEKLKKERQSQGVQNFDKMARIGYATARLVPGPVGWTTNIIDLANENAGSGDILATGEPGVNSLADHKAKTSGLLNKPWGKDLLKFSKMFQVYPIRAFDAVFDAKQLYDEITSEKQGGRFTFKKNRLLKNAEALNKKDMRKKFVKSDNPTYKRNRVNNKAKKYQVGGQLLYEDNLFQPEIKVDPSIFVSWNNISTNNIELPEFDFSTPSSPNYSFIDKFNDSIIINSINKGEEKKSEEKESTKEENTSKKETPVIEEYTYKGRNQWAKDLVESYKRAGITNPNALKYLLAQDALESGWGKSAQGKYNYGNLTTGSSWKGNYVQGKDKDAAGNPISQKFRSYSSMDEYTRDKIDFLTRLYNFNQNDTLDIFISKLLGNNSGKRRYTEARNYGEVLKNVYNSVNKYQEGGVLIFGDPETSEMLTYRMQDGSIKSVPNPGAGYVSGTDPVGQVVVEGAILNKPLGWFSSKAINWVKGLLSRRGISVGNFNKGEEVISNSTNKTIKKEDLPSYADPNWQGNSVELTKDRLRNGGFDRLEDNYEGAYKYTEEHKNNILKAAPADVKSSDLSFMGITPENVGVGLKGASSTNTPLWGVLRDAPEIYKTGQPFYDLSSHEFSHW